jgi:hypothetical protein
MKNVFFLIIGILLLTVSGFSQVAINSTGTEADASAMLDIGSTEKGMLAPRMTTLQRTAIASPANGLLVYDTDTKSFWHYNNDDSIWVEVVSGVIELNDLSDAITDNYSVFIGDNSGIADDGGNYNTGLGNNALRDVTEGTNNTAVGCISLLGTTTGANNTSVGYHAMIYNTTGQGNVAIGVAANSFDYDGDSSTFVGTKSGFSIDGTKNCGYGYGSLAYIDGDRNTAIGSLAGYGIFGSSINYDGCVLIGYEAGRNNTEDNKLYIENSDSDSPLIGGDFSTDQVDINGTIKITGGTPGNGKILTSDADGLASWESNPGATVLNDLTDAKTFYESIFIGENSGLNITEGIFCTAIGYGSLRDLTTGMLNTAIGSTTLMKTDTGDMNTAIGFGAMQNNTTGNSNVAIGVGANSANLDGDSSTFVGTRSGSYIDGDKNCGFGYGSLAYIDGDRNTAIGSLAGYGISGSSINYDGCVLIGYEAGRNNTSDNRLYIENSDSDTPLIGGDFSTNQVDINGTIKITGGTPGNGKVLTSDADGLASWEDNTGATELDNLSDASSDASSVFIGEGSGNNDDGNNYNTAVGFETLNLCSSGLNNSALGYQALAFLTEGSNNTAFGVRSLYDNTTGSKNTAYGRGTLANNTEGVDNVGLGYQTLVYNSTGNNNTAVGSNAGYSAAGNNYSGCIFLGYSAGYQNTSDNKLYIDNSSTTSPLIGGDFSTKQVDINGTLKITGGTPGNGKVLTSDADGLASWEYSQGAVGLDGLSDAHNDGISLFIGNRAGNDANTNTFNTCVGNISAREITSGSYNTSLGVYCLIDNTIGDNNIAIGAYPLQDNVDGNNNIAIGSQALIYNVSGYNNTAVGYYAGKGSEGLSFSGCVFLGNMAGRNNTSDSKLFIDNSSTSSPLIGGDFCTNQVDINGTIKITGGTPGNGKVLTSNANGLASWEPTSGATQINDLSDAIYNGSDLFLGNGAGESNSGSNSSVAVGRNALNANTSSIFNTAIGYSSLDGNTGERNTAVGSHSLGANTSGNNNTSIGYSSGVSSILGSYNTFIGYRTQMNNTNIKVNSTAIGNEAIITSSNQVRIGNSSVTSIGGVVSWSTVSDGRFKDNIKEDVAGLDFVLNLRPVSYTVNKQAFKNFVGSEYKSNNRTTSKRECGFVAQEVEELINNTGVEFNGVDAPENGDDYYGIRYSQFVIPLVKSVQELNEKLEKENAKLKAQNAEMLLRLEKLEAIILKK